MSALGRLLRNRRDTATRAEEIPLEEFGQLLTGKQSGDMSERRALGLAAWYSGVRYLAESLAYLTIRAFRNDDPRALPLWMKTPEVDRSGRPLMTRGRLWELWMLSLIHDGNGYGFKLRDPIGRVTGMRYLHPKRVKVRMEDNDKIFSVDTNGNGDRRDFTSRDIFHLVGLSDNGVTGISAVAYHSTNLELAAAGDEFAKKYFDQGAAIAAYIKLTENTRKPIKDLRAEFEEFFQGLNNAHRGAVLSHNAEYKTVDLNARDAQILEARQWSVLEIARILRVPPHKIYDLSRATFSNIEQQAIEAVGDGPRIWAERFEEQIAADPDLIASGHVIRHDLDELSRGDTRTEVAALHTGILDGYVSLADARRRRGLEPAPGMDVYYRPSNVNVVDAATGEIIVPAGAPGTSAADSSDDPMSVMDDGADPPDGGEGEQNRSRSNGQRSAPIPTSQLELADALTE